MPKTEKVRSPLKTIFLGGVFALLPLALIFTVFSWLYNWLTAFVRPLASLIDNTIAMHDSIAQLISFFLILLLCFITGVIVKTAWGSWLQVKLETVFLKKVPGYSMFKELVAQFQPGKTPAFSQPVLITFDNGEHHFMGFVTDELDGICTVFVPTSPSPMNGFAIQTRKENLKYVNTEPETMMKSVLSCGLGASKFSSQV